MKQIADNVRAARATVTSDAIKSYFQNLRISLIGILSNNLSK